MCTYLDGDKKMILILLIVVVTIILLLAFSVFAVVIAGNHMID